MINIDHCAHLIWAHRSPWLFKIYAKSHSLSNAIKSRIHRFFKVQKNIPPTTKIFVCYYICFDFGEFSFLIPCLLPFVTLLKAVTASSPSLEESTVKWHLLKIFLTLWFHTLDTYSPDKPLVKSLWKPEHLVLATPRAIHAFEEFAKLTEAWLFWNLVDCV